jgi:hypothetical protein
MLVAQLPSGTTAEDLNKLFKDVSTQMSPCNDVDALSVWRHSRGTAENSLDWNRCNGRVLLQSK